MIQDRPTYCLTRGNGASPVFHRIGESSETDKNDLLLAGGFSAVSSEKTYTLSAALQLNGDLAMFDDSLLKQFADAELRRKNRSFVKSYTQEPNTLVCAISDNPDQLNSFLDTFGGILQIEPLLIKTTDPDFEQITTLSIRSDKNNYCIQYEHRSPVNFTKCNYCGDCGVVCPEECITETLFFDYKSCTFCKECEKTCSQNAIDIYAIEKKKLVVPAAILLEETTVELPDRSDRIFNESDIKKYLATLFPYQVEEILLCNDTICQISKNGTAGCTQCIDTCPTKSISYIGKISIDSISCIECGNCAALCPTGAIQYQRYPDESFLEFFRDFFLPRDSTVVLGDEKELHRFWWKNRKKSFNAHVFLEHPNLNTISLFQLLFLFSHGVVQIILLTTQKSPILSKTVSDANRIIDMLWGSPKAILFSSVETYQAATNQNKKIHEITYQDLTYINRREKISSILQFMVENNNKSITFKNDALSNFATVLCDANKCTQCLACLNDCKIESLLADPAALKLSWRGSLCVGCGACISTCPEDALSFGDTILIDRNFFNPKVLAQAEPMRCKECGKTFGTKKSFDHVMKILSAKNMANDGFFEYCEDCRVMKLLESE